MAFFTKLKQYNISTVRKGKCWETAVLKHGFFGAFRPMFAVVSHDHDEKTIREIHDQVKDFVEYAPSEIWPHGIVRYEQFGMQLMYSLGM